MDFLANKRQKIRTFRNSREWSVVVWCIGFPANKRQKSGNCLSREMNILLFGGLIFCFSFSLGKTDFVCLFVFEKWNDFFVFCCINCFIWCWLVLWFFGFIFVAPRDQRTVLYCWCLDVKVFVYFSLFIGVVIFFFCVWSSHYCFALLEVKM